jgi:pimeloyl-ACP methyl ester carboxylesterase
VAKQIVPNNPDSIIERIPTIKIPTLILWGHNDPVIPLEHAHRFNKEILNSKLEVIQKCGHVPHEEKPEQTAEFINKFFND